MPAEPASTAVPSRTRVAEVHLDEWVAPDVCDELGFLRPGKILEWMDVRGSRLNFHGTLYGGTLMRWLESAASLSARAYADGAAMHLSALHGLTFLRPAPRHVFVHIRCNVAHVEGHHLTVFVGVEAEDPIDGTYEETLRAFLTYSAPEARRLAAFECTSEEEHALFREVEGRLTLQRTLERTEP